MTTKSTPPSQPTQPVYIVAKDDVVLPVDGSINKREPEPIFGTQGWDEGLPFDCSTINYIFNNLGKWVKYLNDQRPFDLNPILKAIKDLSDKHDRDIQTLTDKHAEDIQSMTDKVNAMQIKVGGYYFGGSANPSTHLLYGTWVKVEADVTLRSAEQDGSVTGDNTPAVPLKAHTHAASQEVHGHELLGQATSGGGNTDKLSGTKVAGESDGEAVYVLNGVSSQPLVQQVAPTIIVESSGESSPTLDVRGKHIPCVIWKRTA